VPYNIDKYDGSPLTTIADGTVDNSTSITLVGRNTPNYGEIQNENMLHLMENFAGTMAPSGTPLDGQMWYDASNQVMRYYTGSAWIQTSTFQVSGAPLSTNFREGSVYFDTVEQEGKVFYNGEWQDINRAGSRGPAGDGTELRTLFLTGTDTVTRAVTGLIDIDASGTETVTAYFSQHPVFELDPSDPYYAEFTLPNLGLGVNIEPGLNLRQDSSDTALWKSKLSQRGETAYSLNTGSYSLNSDGSINDNGGANIAAANVFHHGAHSVPVVTNTYDLGSIVSEFANLYVSNINLSTGIIPTNSNVFIGTDDQPINTIFVTDIEVDGNLIIEGDDVTIGSPANPVSQGYFEDLFVNNTLTLGNVANSEQYSFPSSVADNSILVSDGNTLVWYDVTSTTSEVTPGQGITVTDTPVTTAQGVTTVSSEIGVDAGTGLQFGSSDELEVNLGDFTTDDLSEGSNNLYFTDARVEEAFTDSSTVTVNLVGGKAQAQVPGGQVVGEITDGTGTTATTSQTSGVMTYQVDVNAGTGLTVNGSNQITVDPQDLRDIDLYEGGTSTFGTISVDNSGVITISDLSVTALGTDTRYLQAGSSPPQSRTGTLTIAGIQIATGSIQNINNSLTVNGTLNATGDITGVVTTSSDRRLKQDITPLTDCLSQVARLMPVKYSRKADGRTEIGLIAQDVQAVVPEVVRESFQDQGGEQMLGVQYGNLVSVLIGAIQDLKEQSENQKREIAELREQIELLQRRMER
jgi:hypothetical protein